MSAFLLSAPSPGAPSAASAAPSPVSGRYEGVRQISVSASSVLDLRVDIDPRDANAVVLNKVSGDFYRQNHLPGHPPQPLTSRVYVESWIVDQPSAVWQNNQVEITGEVRYYNGHHHPATTIRIVIPWTQGNGIGPAEVTLRAAGGTPTVFVCALRSRNFRDVDLEIDVCQSVNANPVLPSYDTSWHNDRPADISPRIFTLETSYAEAGIGVRISPDRTVIDDTDPKFSSWTSAELHDAMETHYSGYQGVWPAWRLWGLLAGEFERPGVGGIMFDAAAANGGAGKAPERQGFAVFRKHQWFTHLTATAPANQDQAWAMRHFLYTYVHEAGHAFNFLHSWDKNRANALSWMNYDWRYEQDNGADTFWQAFRFRFDDDELVHLRHGDRKAVIMGGDAWGKGNHIESPPLADAQSTGIGPLEVLLRSKQYFEFMEPVSIEVRIRNRTSVPLSVDPRLAPEYGAISYYVQRVGDPVEDYEPLLCYLSDPENLELRPADESEGGGDRHSELVSLTYGKSGFYFDRPGTYLIRAVYQSRGEHLEPSNTLTIRVGYPHSREREKLACDFFSTEVGISLYLDGSKSPHLEEGMNVISEVHRRESESAVGVQLGQVLAASEERAFHRLKDGKMQQVHKADPEKSLLLTEPVISMMEREEGKEFNLRQRKVAERRICNLRELGDKRGALAEGERLLSSLAKRKTKPNVLKEIQETILAADGGAKQRGGPPGVARRRIRRKQ